MSKHNPKAFTITELLVVIAIVAVLAALLFPVFSRAAHQSKQSAAKSNLKQLYIGLQLYVEQYDGHSGTLVEQDIRTTNTGKRANMNLWALL